MPTVKKLRPWIPVILCAVAAVVIHVRGARPTRAHAAMPLAAGTPGGAPTSRDGLATTIAALERLGLAAWTIGEVVAARGDERVRIS